MAHFENLFSPITIGNLKLKNRIVMASMGTNLSNHDGTVSDRAVTYYSERAKGGAGLIITEASPVSLIARHRPESLCCYDDSFIPRLRRLTAAIHDCDSAICLQLHHSGRVIAKTVGIEDGRVVISKEGTEVKGTLPLAPSPIPREPGAPVPKEMNLEDIYEVIGQFGSTARRAKEAGFDAVEIHAGHGYLIQQFLSPRVNKRKDPYGGSSERRGRFLMEIMQQVRKEVGESFPVIVRLSAQEYIEGGYTLEEILDWAKELEHLTASVISISGGSAETLLSVNYVCPPMSFPKAIYVPHSEAVRRVVRIPVIVVGRLDTPTLAEHVLKEGKADLVAIGRPFLSDPYWPTKAYRGEEDRIRQCIACNYCLWVLFQQKPITCFQNACVGQEEECNIYPASKTKKVIVVGGGPGGLEAARVARKRGHRVTLLEKNPRLGGQILLASVAPYKENFLRAVEWLTHEIEREGVEIKLNIEATAETVLKEKPEAVILATGAFPISRFTHTCSNVIEAWEVLAGKNTGKNVLILGGGMVGMETAELLNQRGCRVTVITSRESVDKLAVDMIVFSRNLFLQRLAASDISIEFSTRVVEIRDGSVFVKKESKERRLEADTIVLAGGSKANNDLLKALQGRGPQVLSLGDCVDPRSAKEAIHEGFQIALNI